MTRRLLFAILFLPFLALTACTGNGTPPTINFIGIGIGTLDTDVDTVEFSPTFKVTDTNLLGVATFDPLPAGATVTATWFTPDEKAAPLGRTEVITESDATIARFSFGSKEEWKPAPYMLRIDIRKGQGSSAQTANEAVLFFIGMEDEEIQEYVKDYQERETREREQENALKLQEDHERALKAQAASLFQADTALLAMKQDILETGSPQYLFLDTREQPEFRPSESPGIAISTPVRQFVLMDESGVMFLSLLEQQRQRLLYAGIKALGLRVSTSVLPHLTILPSGTSSLSYEEKEKQCVLELEFADGKYQEKGEAKCR